MNIYRTPESRFKNLLGFPFSPNYLYIDDGKGGKLRMHYIDEGPKNSPTIFCVHGQPVWSYSYRKMIPILVTSGYRVIAPDIVGFGRSDKPTNPLEYTFNSHVTWMHDFVRKMYLKDITLVCQDWGGAIGLRIVAADPDRFLRVVVSNTGLADARDISSEMAKPLRQLLAETPILNTIDCDAAMRQGLGERGGFQDQARNAASGSDTRPPFMYWIQHCAMSKDFSPGKMMKRWLISCSEEEQRGYAAPFPVEASKQGARRFPSLIPLFPDDAEVPANREAWEALRKFNKPFLTAFSEEDPGKMDQQFQKEIPGARQQKHVRFKGAMHYTQDDAAQAFAEVVLEFIADNSQKTIFSSCS